MEAPTADEQLNTLRPTLTVKNGTSDQAGTRTYEFQISDTADFSTAVTAYIPSFNVTVAKTGVAEGADGRTTFTPDSDLQPTTRFYWRARMTQGATVSEWSTVGKFRSKLVGFIRDGALFDPLIHGETVGERIGSTTFIPGKGLKLNSVSSFVRYRLPRAVVSGEYSMDVEGLAANGPGDKPKVFGMQEGTTEFVTNDYRVDVQYRGVKGSPVNAIYWRVIYGDGSDDALRYETDRARRKASVVLLNPSTTYHWKFTYGSEIRLVILDGGMTGDPVVRLRNAGDARPVQPEPPRRLSRSACRSQRRRVRVHRGDGLPERLAGEPAATRLARKRALEHPTVSRRLTGGVPPTRQSPSAGIAVGYGACKAEPSDSGRGRLPTQRLR